MKMLPRQNKRKLSCSMMSNQDNDPQNGPSSSHTMFASKKPHILSDQKSISPSVSHFTTDNWNNSYLENEIRLKSGHHEPCIMSVMSLYDCKTKKDEKLSHSEKIITPTVIQLQLSQSHTNAFLQRHIQCLHTSQKKRPAKMSRGTQTLYRESSMQTLPYLPDVSNDQETLKTLELFKLPTILKGDGPPGLCEVEILERARKRWAFEKAIKENFQCAMKRARTEVARKKLIPQHKAILEAFEWEHWLQREELIQGCQMMRFQLVLGIFEKREREMHKKTTLRIQKCCEDIVQKRDQALMKNDIDFGREMRRLKIKHERKPRNWRKEKISDQLGDPSSEYYAPQMRYGVNPNRRHFQLSRKAFEMRMEDLGKRAVNMKNLECPFAKLKEWSKPKVQVPEVEPNFCTETNLQKLYEGLKNLREQSKKQKVVPKCLVEKLQKTTVGVMASENPIIEELDTDQEEEYTIEIDEEAVQVGSSYSRNSLYEMNSQRNNQHFTIMEMLDERRSEELESMLAEYEGTQIGWLMRFLSEEMCRLQEQRKLHFVTMLAQKERWRREAAEAGLRQKENEMRKIYEEIFDETHQASREVCEQYLDNIFGIDTHEQADFEAKANITELARLIDSDLQRWVGSFQLIQNPLNYDNLRYLLRDLVFPETIAEYLCQKYEMQSIIDFIINDVLFKRVYELLEPFDISSSLANDLVDRLIDNDLYIFSSECSSSCDCQGKCECRPRQLEAKAILRKLIRYSVPGNRWRSQTERIADENVKDIVENVCSSFTAQSKSRSRMFAKVSSKFDLMQSGPDSYEAILSDSSTDNSYSDTITVINYGDFKKKQKFKSGNLVSKKKHSWDDTTKSSSPLKDVNDLSNQDPNAKAIPYPFPLKKTASFFDVTAPVKAEESDIAQASSDEIRSVRTVYFPDMQQSTESFLENIISKIIKSIVSVKPSETSKHEYAESVKLMASKSRLCLTKKKSDISSSYNTELSDSTEISEDGVKKILYGAFVDEVERSYDSKSYEMLMYEGELEKILCDDDECKCQMEIDYKNHIRELYESGKIKILRKEQETTFESETDETGKNIDVAELMFEYMTSADVDFEADHFVGPMEEEEMLYKTEELTGQDDEPRTELDAEAHQESGGTVIGEEVALGPNEEQPTVNETQLDVAEAPTEQTQNIKQSTPQQEDIQQADNKEQENAEQVASLISEAAPKEDIQQADDKDQKNTEQVASPIAEAAPKEDIQQADDKDQKNTEQVASPIAEAAPKEDIQQADDKDQKNTEQVATPIAKAAPKEDIQEADIKEQVATPIAEAAPKEDIQQADNKEQENTEQVATPIAKAAPQEE